MITPTQTLTVTIDSDTAAKLQASVDAGTYPSVTAAARAALETWYDPVQAKEEIRRLVQEGLESGEPIPGAVVFERLKRRYGG
ncbi:type II toxin-antitoxin system ParD family antitoxin [Elstera sp.]|jgi:Arc/MetJ-type ribon-helix-helix transcriptional regulator|uniref:type II toxin-antitoxin system ParD family antitoxin n=1 Tax=Elstera sp. TaxID=1916664 RepID=UPI0037BF93E1